MKPGQKVRAVVRLEEADGVIAIPRGAVFEKDGKRVVYRRERRRLRPGRGDDRPPEHLARGARLGPRGGRRDRAARPDARSARRRPTGGSAAAGPGQ